MVYKGSSHLEMDDCLGYPHGHGNLYGIQRPWWLCAFPHHQWVGRPRAWYLVVHPTDHKWAITPVLSGLSALIPFITRVVTHLLSGMSQQVVIYHSLRLVFIDYFLHLVFFFLVCYIYILKIILRGGATPVRSCFCFTYFYLNFA